MDCAGVGEGGEGGGEGGCLRRGGDGGWGEGVGGLYIGGVAILWNFCIASCGKNDGSNCSQTPFLYLCIYFVLRSFNLQSYIASEKSTKKQQKHSP